MMLSPNHPNAHPHTYCGFSPHHLAPCRYRCLLRTRKTFESKVLPILRDAAGLKVTVLETQRPG